jgi:hypothetical protein
MESGLPSPKQNGLQGIRQTVLFFSIPSDYLQSLLLDKRPPGGVGDYLPAREFESVADELDTGSSRKQLHRHHIKPRRMVAQVFFGKIIERYSGDFILLFATHGELRDQGVTLPGDDIDLSEAALVITLDDAVTGFGKIRRSQFLSSFSRAFSRQRHGFLHEGS